MEISNRDLLQVETSVCNYSLTLPLIFHLLEQDTNQQQTLCIYVPSAVTSR